MSTTMTPVHDSGVGDQLHGPLSHIDPTELKFRTFALLQVSGLPFRRAPTSLCPY
jgi:hypothetical protein